MLYSKQGIKNIEHRFYKSIKITDISTVEIRTLAIYLSFALTKANRRMILDIWVLKEYHNDVIQRINNNPMLFTNYPAGRPRLKFTANAKKLPRFYSIEDGNYITSIL